MQIVTFKCHFPPEIQGSQEKAWIPGLGQEMYELSIDRLVILDSKDAMKKMTRIASKGLKSQLEDDPPQDKDETV